MKKILVDLEVIKEALAVIEAPYKRSYPGMPNYLHPVSIMEKLQKIIKDGENEKSID